MPDRPRRAPRKALRPAAAGLTIASAVELYISVLPTLTNRRGRPYLPRTIEAYSEHLNLWARWAGERELAELTGDLVASYLADRRRDGLSQWTVATRDKVLRIWLGWLVGRGVIERSPLDGARRLVAKDPPIEIFTADQVGRLLATCDYQTWVGTRDRAIIYVLWRTGLRASELVNLDLDDYMRQERRLRVRHGKGDEDRVVGVPDDAAGALDDWVIVVRGEKPGPLFQSDRGELERLDRCSLGHRLARLGERAGVPGVHPHRFRHTFARDFLLAGGQDAILMRVLGHKSLAMTMRYLRAIQGMQAADRHVETMRGRQVRR